MLSINTNLSSLIAQNSLTKSTNSLNQAIERMSTGFKINNAKDNAANYSISTNMTTKIGAYQIAEENCAMGLDMVTTASSTLDLVSEHVQRIRDLCEQASNGTYGNQSLQAIQSEIDARLAEIERIQASSEYNGIKLFESEQLTPATFATPRAGSGVTGAFIEEVEQLTEEQAIAQGYTIIKTADELQSMKDNQSGKYILMNDIDLDGYDWTLVGTDWSNVFTGELNGNGFVIKNLTINKPTEDHVGLFGYTNGAIIKNLGIEDANVTGQESVGILVGRSMATNISNCYISGIVNAERYVGGFTGSIEGGSLIKNCYSNIDITGNSDVGGICGVNTDAGGGNIENSYSTGKISGDQYIGGIIGKYDRGGGHYVKNCYSTSVVTGNINVGTLFGYRNASDDSINCYYDKERSGVATGTGNGQESGIQGVTTAELQSLIDNGSLPKINPLYEPTVTPTGSPSSIKLQVGTNGDSNSQITFGLATTLTPLEITITDSDSARGYLSVIDNYLSQISNYQTSFGAVQNRLESCLEEISVQYDNLVSSRSTLRDADIAEESSKYIQQQILQQASATLMATANQTPAIALQLL